MAGTNVGTGWVAWGWGAGLLACMGCQGGDVSVGREREALNAGRCYATNCSTQVTPSVAEEPAFEACGEPAGGALQDELVFASTGAAAAPDVLRVALDDSLWVLRGARAHAPIVLEHYSTQGRLLGVTPPLATINADIRNDLSDDLVISDDGHAFVTLYAVVAPTAGANRDDFLVLHEFDEDLHEVREPLAFAGIRESQVVIGTDGKVRFAGDALHTGDASNDGPSGILVRVTAGQVDWTQTSVPAGEFGVTALAINDAGVSSVLSQRKTLQGAINRGSYTFGVVRFDDAGNWLSDVTLPTAYAAGYSATLVSAANGDVMLAGILDQEDTTSDEVLVLSKIDDGGVPAWAFRVAAGGVTPTVGVDRESGRSFTLSKMGVAVVAADGESCAQYSLPDGQKGGLLAVAAPYLFVWVGGEVRRYRLPAK